MLCGVVTTIEGTQKNKKFFLTLVMIEILLANEQARFLILSWARATNREKFKVTMSTRVRSNHN